VLSGELFELVANLKLLVRVLVPLLYLFNIHIFKLIRELVIPHFEDYIRELVEAVVAWLFEHQFGFRQVVLRIHLFIKIRVRTLEAWRSVVQ